MIRPGLEGAAAPLASLEEQGGVAAEEMLELAYDELRGMARGLFRGPGDRHTLQPTALVHEAWVRVAERTGLQLQSRSHFCALCAVVMRQILADYARRRRTSKRGGDRQRIDLDKVDPIQMQGADLVALDDALVELSHRDERQAKVVEYRYFAGMTVEQVSEVLGVSRSTIEADWRMARAWLAVQLGHGDGA